MLRALLYLSTSSPKHFFFSISLARLNWVYDVLICLVRLTQMFANEDHNMKMFSKIATFLQNQFLNKLIYDFISQLIFKLSSTNERLFQGESNCV